MSDYSQALMNLRSEKRNDLSTSLTCYNSCLKSLGAKLFFCTSSLVYQQHFSVDKCLPFLTFQYLKKIISPKQMCEECFSFLTFLFNAVFDFHSIFPHPLPTLSKIKNAVKDRIVWWSHSSSRFPQASIAILSLTCYLCWDLLYILL